MRDNWMQKEVSREDGIRDFLWIDPYSGGELEQLRMKVDKLLEIATCLLSWEDLKKLSPGRYS